MKLSTKSRYALEGLVYIAIYSPNEAIRIKQIAEDTGITVAYLEQIFFLLKKARAPAASCMIGTTHPPNR